MTKRQQKVYNAAKEKLKSEEWFDGVDMTNFPTDEECHDFNEAVNSVCFETAMWDDPNFNL